MQGFSTVPILSDRRSREGSVLIIVVGLLAILMLLATTLALTSRVELKASQNYEAQQAVEQLAAATQAYCIDLLRKDKYGADDYPCNYEKLGNAPTGGIYPLGGRSGWVTGDDEGFDSYLTEEWLPPSDMGEKLHTDTTWRAFNDASKTDNVYLRDTNGDGKIDTSDRLSNWLPASWILGEGKNSLLGGEVVGQFALYFFDAGGRRLDVNSTGNTTGYQSQGLTPFEINLSGLWGDSSIVTDRYGPDGEPGEKDFSDSNLLGHTALDFNFDGVVEDYSDPDDLRDEPTEFIPEWPVASASGYAFDRPYGTDDLFYLLWGNNSAARVSGVSNRSWYTTATGITIHVGRGLRTDTLFNATNPGQLTTKKAMNGLYYRRAAQNFTSSDVGELAQLAWDLGPVVQDSTGSSAASPFRKRIVLQTVLNVDRALEDANALGAVKSKFDGNDRNYFPVEVVPYIAEVECAIDTSHFGYVPESDGKLPTDLTSTDPEIRRPREGPMINEKTGGGPPGGGPPGGGPPGGGPPGGGPPGGGGYKPSDDVWIDNNGNGKYDQNGDVVIQGSPANNRNGEDFKPQAQNTNCPPTGWGKYIKLVNPWNKEISLDGYEIVIPAETGSTKRLRKWEFSQSDGRWNSTPVASDIRISLSGKKIPARGHFLIVDNGRTTDGPFSGILSQLHQTFWKQDTRITFMQEAKHGIDDNPQHNNPVDGFESTTFGPTVVELRTTAGDLVMRFRVQESPAGEPEDDDDSFGNKNQTTQIGDPRPCYMRNTNASSIELEGQDAPWAMTPELNVHESTHQSTYSDDVPNWTPDWIKTSGNVTAREWFFFNRNWRDEGNDSATQPVGGGDGYFLLYSSGGKDSLPDNEGNVLESFAPADRNNDGDGASDEDPLNGADDDKDDRTDEDPPDAIMNQPLWPSPAYLSQVHAAMPWTTLNLTNEPATGGCNLVYLRGVIDLMVGPVSPFENQKDDDADGVVDDASLADFTHPTRAHLGPEIRLRGRVNVNTANEPVLKSALPWHVLKAWSGSTGVSDTALARDIARAIIHERTVTGPYSSIEDLMERVPELFGRKLDRSTEWVTLFGSSASPRPAYNLEGPMTDVREGVARFIANLITVRTDVWGVVGRVQLLDSETGEKVATKGFYMVIDRSFDPPRIMLQRDAESP